MNQRRVQAYILTLDLVGGGGSDLGLAVFQKVLESWHEVILGDFGSDCLL